jgi:hypothetical protein
VLGARRDIGETLPPAAVGSVRAMEGAMPKANLWKNSVLLVEFDQRHAAPNLRLASFAHAVAERPGRRDGHI